MTGIKPKVLLADDEAGLRELLRVYLEHSGFEVTEAGDGLEAEQELAYGGFDLLILDIMMPKLDGLTLCKRVRKEKLELLIMLLTAKGDESDRVLGFKCGADDYVVKPFSPRELAARAKALLRRSPNFQPVEQGRVTYPDLVIDNIQHRIVWCGEEVELTPKEFSLLYLMAKTPRRVFSREQISSQAWNENHFCELRIVDVHINNLREKFNIIRPFHYVQMVRGIGYKFNGPQ